MSIPEGEQDFGPFSLVMGPNFMPYSSGGMLSNEFLEVRDRIVDLVGLDEDDFSTPWAATKMVNVLATGQLGANKIPELQPQMGKGVTFTDPNKLYSEFGSPEALGPAPRELMRRIIQSATQPKLIDRDSIPKIQTEMPKWAIRRSKKLAHRAIQLAQAGRLDRELPAQTKTLDEVLAVIGLRRVFHPGIYEHANTLLADRGIRIEHRTRYLPMDGTVQDMTIRIAGESEGTEITSSKKS